MGNRWEQGAEEVWNGQYQVVDGAVTYPIVLDVEFVDHNQDASVRVILGDGRDRMDRWYTGNPGGWGNEYQEEVVAHEIGHMLGLYDEYDKSDGAFLDPNNPIWDMTSIMGSLDGAPKERHYGAFLQWLEDETGRNMVLGQQPSFDPGRAGGPVFDDRPAQIPEPASVMLLLGGLAALARRRRSSRAA